jgi:GT2 family glycosyltransferase
MTKISAIILSYNTVNLLRDCLNSLLAKTKNTEMEIIVIDNNSIDNSAQMVRKEFPQVELIVNPDNYGFSKGNNIGLKKAKGDYVLLINSDVVFVEDSISGMVNLMEKSPKIGVSSCKLIGSDNKIQPTGGFFPTILRVFAWMLFIDDVPILNRLFNSYHPPVSWYGKEQLQDWVTGAFFMIRKQVIEDVGYLDENIFMYAEEMEYCYRAKKLGWFVKYSPVTKIIHLGGKSGTSKGALLGELKSIKYFYQKHMPNWQGPLLIFLLKLGSLLRVIAFAIIKPKSDLKGIYAEAFRKV